MSEAQTRRTDRIQLAIPILVTGTDVMGSAFVEQTNTVLVGRYGAMIILRRALAPDQEINVRNVGTGEEADMRVIGQIGDFPEGIGYGVGFLNPLVNFWGIDFPPLLESENAVAKVLLACARCNRSSLVCLNEIEVEVFLEHGDIWLPCSSCRDQTLWKRPGSAPAQASLAPTPPQVGQERRKNSRLNLRMQVCIRTKEFGDVVATTENVSRRGFCFKSTQLYGVGETVEVCLPFSPGPGNVFSTARIAHMEAHAKEGVNSYGVTYLLEHRHWPGD